MKPVELFNDHFQNYKVYGIPHAQLIIADIPYNIGKNAYASNPAWYKDGDNKNGESELAGKEFFDTDKDFRPAEFMQHYKGRILKLRNNNKGYCIVTLQVHRNFDTRLVSRLVAEAFIPNPNNLPIVNHKDQVPTNNMASNLEWCTIQYNVTYANAVEMRATKLARPIEQLTLDGKHVAFYKSANEAERICGYDHTNIGRVIHGKQMQYMGFFWRYTSNDQ